MNSNTKRLSRLMKISWDIQRSNHKTRSKALQAAWAIISNADITVFYLVRRLNHHKPVADKTINQFSLFAQNQ